LTREDYKTFENVSSKKRGVKLKRSIAILNNVLVKLQFAVTESAVAESENRNKIGRQN